MAYIILDPYSHEDLNKKIDDANLKEDKMTAKEFIISQDLNKVISFRNSYHRVNLTL